MKRILTGMLSGFLLIFPMVCSATWKIHLKDGRSFTTPEYREEGDQIKFERYGGLIGLPRDQVMDIEKIEDVPKEEVLKPPEAPPVLENKKEAATVSETPPETAEVIKGKATSPKKEDPQLAFMKEKRRILSEKENISQAFEDAKARNDRKEKDLYWNKLLQIQNKLRQLQNRVAAENEGVLPPWWEQIR